MRVNNSPDFNGVNWENFANTKNWILPDPPNRFKNVYVQIEDGEGKRITTSDNIFYGSTVPYGYFDSLAQGSTHSETLNLTGLNNGGKPYMQFSDNWGYDVITANMSLLSGQGGPISDPASSTGSAYQLQTNGNNNSWAWFYTSTYIRDLPSQMYLRLKMANINSLTATLDIDINAGDNTQSRHLTPLNLASSNTYQEFVFSFTQPTNPNNDFLTVAFTFRDPGTPLNSVSIDKVDFYTAPESFSTSKTWSVPTKNHRAGNVRVRYTDNNGLTPSFSTPEWVASFLTTYNPVLPYPPFSPASLGATAISGTQVNLNWTDRANDETGFKIERKTGVGGVWAQVNTVGANQQTFQDTGLTPGTQYFYRVRAYNNYGDSDYSNEYSATTFLTPPLSPDTLGGVADNRIPFERIQLSWHDNASNETGYRIDRRVGAGSWGQIVEVPANTTVYTDDNLTPATSYQYRVYAYNSAGNSSYSNTATVTTASLPNASYTVRNNIDRGLVLDGDVPDTLSNALKYATSGQAIYFAVTSIQAQGSLPVLGYGVLVNPSGSCSSPISINYMGSAVVPLQLSGNTFLKALNFTKTRLWNNSLGTGNLLKCVKVNLG